MSEGDDKGGKKPAGAAPADAKPAENKSSGRVAFDARGNPIWEWQLETGVYSRDVTTQRLKKLDLGDLSLAETAPHKKLEGLEPDDKKIPARKALPGGGFNPYDSGPASTEGSNPYDKARALAKKVSEPQPAPAAPRTPADLRKLNEWIKLKRSVEEDKNKIVKDDDE